MEAVRILAGAIIDLLPVPDGDLRETLLNVANPRRPEVKQIIKRSDAEDERAALRRHFKAVDTGYVSDDALRTLVACATDRNDSTTFTAVHDHTDEALRALRDDLDGDGEPDNTDVPDDTDGLEYKTDVNFGFDTPYDALASVKADDVQSRQTPDPDEYAAFLAWKTNQSTNDTEVNP